MTLEISTLVVKLKSMGYALFLEGEKLRYKSLSLIEPPREKALPLLEIIKRNREAVIAYLRQKAKTPGLAYKIYSEIFDSILWVCDTEAHRRLLQQRGATEPIYTGAEILELKRLPKDDKGKKALSCIHRTKAVFAGDTKIERR